MEEITIDIKDCLKKILLKWRRICLWIVVVALLTCVAGAFWTARKARQSEETGETQDLEASLQEAADVLSNREIGEVESAVSLYYSYYEEMTATTDYLQNSIRMQLDSSCVPTMVLQYYIDSHFQVVYPVIDEVDRTTDIINSYITLLDVTANYEEISSNLQDTPDAAYVQELVSYSTTANDLLTITIVGLDREYCETIAGTLRPSVENATKKLQKIYGDFDITPLDERYSERVNSSLLTSQQTEVNALSTVKTAINNLSTNLTDDQKTYFGLLLDSQVEELPNAAEGAEEEPETTQTAGTGGHFSVKYLILGILAGIFLAVVWYGLKYILSSRLRVSVDMEDVYGTHLLGELRDPTGEKKRENGLDRKIRTLFEGKRGDFSEEERIRMVCAGIRIAAQKGGMKQIYLTGACGDDRTERVMERLCEDLRGENVSVLHGKSVVYDPESLERLAASDGVVLVEQIGASYYQDIKKECELCARNQVPVIGSVVLD